MIEIPTRHEIKNPLSGRTSSGGRLDVSAAVAPLGTTREPPPNRHRKLAETDPEADRMAAAEEEGPTEPTTTRVAAGQIKVETRCNIFSKLTNNYAHRSPISLFGSSTVLDCLEPTIGSLSTLPSGNMPTCCSTLAWSQ